MKLTILIEDNTVIVNGVVHTIDLTKLNLEHINAIQWDGEQGEIEYKDVDGKGNELINELPEWVDGVVEKWTAVKEQADARAVYLSVDTPYEFLDDYPTANINNVNRILTTANFPGIKNSALYHNSELKGIETTEVAAGPAALNSLKQLLALAINLGVGIFSNKITIAEGQESDMSPNFIKYMEDLGYVLWEGVSYGAESQQLYYPWGEEQAANKTAQDAKWERENSIEEGVEFKGHTFSTDPISRDDIMDIVTAISANLYTEDTITWADNKNNKVELTSEEFYQLAKVVIEKVTTEYAKV